MPRVTLPSASSCSRPTRPPPTAWTRPSTPKGSGTWRLYTPDHTDYHVYAHWIPIVARRAWTPEGGPWRWAHRDVTYDLNTAPRTLDLLGRAVHLDVNPLFSNEDVEETAEAVVKVLEGVL